MMATSPCPICEKPVDVGSDLHPFCSRKCRLADLNRWFGEAYRVPATKMDEEDADQDQPE
jgi:hypothetical protein